MRIEISNINQFNKMLFSNYELEKIPNVKGLTIDSRLVKKDDVFIPLKGKKFNGHNFITDAIDLGASLIFSEKAATLNLKKIHSVKSTYNCLKNIAREWRKYFNGDVIGITGSNGKTTTKELLAYILKDSIKCNYSSTINFCHTKNITISSR